MRSLKIYLCDLTYDTITLSTDAFPLNVGYIASYAKKQFQNKLEITIFKYIDKLESALESNPPDIIGFSNYAWNRQISKEMSKIFLQKNPNGLVVWGGPNFPADLPSQQTFFKNFPEIDIYVPIEGEIGFSNIVERVLEKNSVDNLRDSVLNTPIPGCITRLSDGELKFGFTEKRIKQLDEIESPYLSGILDEFFDGRLVPMIQTNRGCPFSCTFCTDGSDNVRMVNQFTSKRVDDELKYIASKVPKNTHSLHISDLNFGMYAKDMEVCDSINRIQQKYDYPKFVKVTSGKNKQEQISKAIQKLGGSTYMSLSVQSLNDQILSNIKRDNISSEKLIALGPSLKQQGLDTVCDVILGLPGETYQTHIQTVRDVMRANIDWVNIWTLMLLDGSELGTPKEREKWDLNVKYRIIPRDFTKLKNGKIVLEIEPVAIGSNTLSSDEYLELRLLSLLIKISASTPCYQSLFKFLNFYHIETFDLVYSMLKNINTAPKNLQKFFNQFLERSRDELWDTEAELLEHFQNQDEYEKLLSGESGQNLAFYFHALAISEHMPEYSDFSLNIAKNLVSKKTNENIDDEFDAMSKYCIGSCHNIFGQDRMNTNPEFIYNFDILAWMNTGVESSLSSFKLNNEHKITFKLTDEQYKIVQDKLDVFGHGKIGRSQTINRIAHHQIWRKPEVK
tara:strand:- start:15 stop:2045 length:2031 start_codon:yes stop_codon:yes gene_type:complete